MLAVLLVAHVVRAAEPELPLPELSEGHRHTATILFRTGGIVGGVGLATVAAGVVVASIPGTPCHGCKDNEGNLIAGMLTGLVGLGVVASSAPLFIVGAVLNGEGRRGPVEVSVGPAGVRVAGEF